MPEFDVTLSYEFAGLRESAEKRLKSRDEIRQFGRAVDVRCVLNEWRLCGNQGRMSAASPFELTASKLSHFKPLARLCCAAQ